MLMKFKNVGLAPNSDLPDPANPGGGAGSDAPAGDPGTQQPSPASGGRESKTVIMQRGTLAKQMRDEREKGRQSALSTLEKKARSLGYKSVDDMFERQAEARKRGASATPSGGAARADDQQVEPPKPPRNGSDNERRRYEREASQHKANLEAEKRARLAERRRNRELEEEKNRIEAERDLERIAVRHGVRETDYAIHLYKQACRGKTQEELAKMDEDEWFAGLHKSHPYLFGETVTGATTGNPPGAPAAPGPRAASMIAAGATGQLDVRKMTKDQYNEYLKRNKLEHPSSSTMNASRMPRA